MVQGALGMTLKEEYNKNEDATEDIKAVSVQDRYNISLKHPDQSSSLINNTTR